MPKAIPPWTFLTNHAHVLLCVAHNPDVRIRDLAALVGVTERGVQRILSELEAGRYIERQRDGRRTHYVVDASLRLRHPIEAHRSVADLIRLGSKK